MKAASKTKAPSKKPAAKQPAPAAKKPVPAAKKPAPAAKKPPAKKPAPAATKPASAAAGKKPAPRADLGAPIDDYFAKQSPRNQPVLAAMRTIVEQTLPAAAASIKWGMPVWQIDGRIVTALRGHAAHVSMMLGAPPEAFDDPAGRLEGDGKTGRHLKVTSVDDIPTAQLPGWLRTAAAHGRGGAK